MTRDICFILSMLGVAVLLCTSCDEDNPTELSDPIDTANVVTDEDTLLLPEPDTVLFPPVSGTLETFLVDDTDAGYGFYLFLPERYDHQEEEEYPLLIDLHGGGSIGGGATVASLELLLWAGSPVTLIETNTWNPPADFIVAAPQTSDHWDAYELHDYIAFLIDQLNVDATRIYLTGWSLGASGIYNYITDMGSSSYAAAVVPIAGSSMYNLGAPFKEVPVWAFHGDEDNIVPLSTSVEIVEAINANEPRVEAKLTVMVGVNHNSWPMVFENSYDGEVREGSAPFDMSIYEWMLQYSREGL